MVRELIVNIDSSVCVALETLISTQYYLFDSKRLFMLIDYNVICFLYKTSSELTKDFHPPFYAHDISKETIIPVSIPTFAKRQKFADFMKKYVYFFSPLSTCKVLFAFIGLQVF